MANTREHQRKLAFIDGGVLDGYMRCGRVGNVGLVTLPKDHPYFCNVCERFVYVGFNNVQFIEEDPDIKLCCHICYSAYYPGTAAPYQRDVPPNYVGKL